MRDLNLTLLLKSVLSAIEEVSAFILREEKRFKSQSIEQKEDRSLVSFVDKEAERQLVEKLKGLLPESVFLTEEQYPETQLTHKSYAWVIDPLDGTTNFVHHIPMYCVSVALLKEGSPILAITYNVPQRECFYAIKGEGCFLGKQRLRVSKTKNLEDYFIAVGLVVSEEEVLRKYSEIKLQLSLKVRAVRRLGTAALQLAYVAAGRLDAYIDINLKPWDTAAGILLVEEAGGRTVTLSGHTYTLQDNELVATNGSSTLLAFTQSVQNARNH